jgi:hypothetical protein
MALIFWASVFMIYLTSAGTTPLDFFLGRYEVPPDLGTWKEQGLDSEVGLIREERRLLPQGHANASYLIGQVRYRDPTTRAIVRIDAEQRLPRRRVGRSAGYDRGS